MELPTFMYAASVILLIVNSVLLIVMLALFRLGIFRGPRGFNGPPGAMGAMGEPASIISFIAVLSSLDDLPDDPEHADCYIVNGRYMVYSNVEEKFQDAGSISRA
tara:strand:- start:74178 stop:74492 length:315 start_codon:yes stop_codon:yes gene_type:complete